jgi:hypothetical protein
MEGRKEEQYKKSPYINNNNNNSNIEEMMSNMTINEKKEKEEGEKKWVEKEEEKKEIKPLWLKKLEELESPFVNETIKSIIEACVESDHECRRRLKKDMDNDKKFHYIHYAMLFFDEERYIDLLNDVKLHNDLNIRKAMFHHFVQGNCSIFLNEDKYENYINGDPERHIFEGKLNYRVPKTKEESIKVIKQIQEIYRTSFIELAMEFDPNQEMLNFLFKNMKDEILKDMKEIKPLFMKEKKRLEKALSVKSDCILY